MQSENFSSETDAGYVILVCFLIKSTQSNGFNSKEKKEQKGGKWVVIQRLKIHASFSSCWCWTTLSMFEKDDWSNVMFWIMDWLNNVTKNTEECKEILLHNGQKRAFSFEITVSLVFCKSLETPQSCRENFTRKAWSSKAETRKAT